MAHGFEDKLTQREVSAVRTSDGAWNVSAVVGGYRQHKTYYGYSKREAVRRFIAEMKSFPNPGVRDLERYSGFEELDQYLGNRESKTLAHNTLVERVDDDHIGVRLHGTRVVMFSRDGAITLNSGRYHTTTTKQRINQFIRPHGWSLVQKQYDWFVVGHGKKYDFEDNMVLPSLDHPARGDIVGNPRQRGTQQPPSPDDPYPDPGKFEGETMLAVEMYDSAMESGADAEDGDSSGPGYYWLFMDFEASDGTMRHGILSEDNSGFISLTEFDTATEAEEVWDEEVQPVIDEWNAGEGD